MNLNETTKQLKWYQVTEEDTYHRFSGLREKIKTGMVLKLKNGELYLVGDVNQQLGVCDDCKDFELMDIAEYTYLLK